MDGRHKNSKYLNFVYMYQLMFDNTVCGLASHRQTNLLVIVKRKGVSDGGMFGLDMRDDDRVYID